MSDTGGARGAAGEESVFGAVGAVAEDCGHEGVAAGDCGLAGLTSILSDLLSLLRTSQSPSPDEESWRWRGL